MASWTNSAVAFSAVGELAHDEVNRDVTAFGEDQRRTEQSQPDEQVLREFVKSRRWGC